MNVFVGVLNLTGFTQVFASSLVDLSRGGARAVARVRDDREGGAGQPEQASVDD
jgi:hypothetical protein